MAVPLVTKLLVLPLFVHVLLISYVGLNTVARRIASARRGEVKVERIALDGSSWPASVRKWSNNFDNQFDVPMLWYGVTALLLALGLGDMVFVALSWAFLVLRGAHTVIHTGSNYVPWRLAVFLAAFAAVFAMWAWLGLRLFVVG